MQYDCFRFQEQRDSAEESSLIVELIEIPAGSFRMGDENGNTDEKPVHEVFVDSFQIGRFAVTNQEFLRFLQFTNYSFDHQYLENPNFSDPHQPAVGMSWFDAIEYCRWLSEQGDHFRLPTEAEWEYAARSGSSENVYPWGIAKWEELPELHSSFENGPARSGSFRPNAFGIHDMGINVHEWCMDWYDANYYQHSSASNPQGPEEGNRRASRGGSWRHQIKITRCAARSSIPPRYRYADYGFRIVRE
jgi:formylglycine-generating enzyme required for sulfatase activity